MTDPKNSLIYRSFTSDLTWSMTRETAAWAEKVGELEKKIAELSAELTRLSNELARKYE